MERCMKRYSAAGGKGRCKGYVFLPDHTIMEEQDRERSRSLWNLKK